MHYSSDFVFDGESNRPYREDDRPNPRSVYAASKLLGEWFAADARSHYVLRVESLFGGLERRKGSLDKIIESIDAGQPVRAFTDRVVSPSYVWDVAEATTALLRSRPAPWRVPLRQWRHGDVVRDRDRGAAATRFRTPWRRSR